MGNQMFQYALGRAMALRYDVPLKLDLTYLLDRTPRRNFVFRSYDLAVFNVKADIATSRDIPWRHRRYFGGRLGLLADSVRARLAAGKGRERNRGFDTSILTLGPNCYLAGYWQSPKYFSQYESQIREDFTLKSAIPPVVRAMKDEIEGTLALCVHVRRTDFVSNPHHHCVSPDYIYRGVEHLTRGLAGTHIYVFSDDLRWCEDTFTFQQPCQFVGNDLAGARAEWHLELMRSCKLFCISSSTFGWWAAWLCEYSDKRVVAPRQWSPNELGSAADLVPRDWMRL